MPAPALIAGLFGAAIGSFLNVVIHRLPAGAGVGGRSRCRDCGEVIRAYDNIPVISWVVLRGRCRSCGEGISGRYPLVELVTGTLFAGIILVRGLGVEGLLGVGLMATLVPVAFIDAEHRIIPNRLLAVSAAVGLAVLALAGSAALPEHLVAGAAAFTGFLCVALAYPGGMGMGDVKLAGVMGLYLGVAILPALLAAFASGTVIGLALMARHGAGARKRAVPFGPFLALGGIVGAFVGPELVALYTRHLGG